MPIDIHLFTAPDFGTGCCCCWFIGKKCSLSMLLLRFLRLCGRRCKAYWD